MTKPPDLGPILAGAGLAIIIAAVVTGFIAVGGPGSARAERIDWLKVAQMHTIANAAACQVAHGDEAPTSLSDLSTNPPDLRLTDVRSCRMFDTSILGQPGVDYERVDATHIRLCADFQRPFDPERRLGEFWYNDGTYPQMSKPRPAGRHCYEFDVGK